MRVYTTATLGTVFTPCPVRMVTIFAVLQNLSLSGLIWAMGIPDVFALFVCMYLYPFLISPRHFNRGHQNILATSLIFGAAGAASKIMVWS